MNDNRTGIKAVVIALDLGGTWIKGCAAPASAAAQSIENIRRWRNPVHTAIDAADYARDIRDLCLELAEGGDIRAVVAATAGEVDVEGRRYLCAGEHLGIMGSTPWTDQFEILMGAPIMLVNDAEAFMLGLAEIGQLPVKQAIGGLVIGTGMGFAVVRDGRWWKPARRLNLLGCALTPQSDYDRWTSAVDAAASAGGDLGTFLTDEGFRREREEYIRGLSRAVATATVLYRLDNVILGGGLVEACKSLRFDLAGAITANFQELLPPAFETPSLCLAENGNAAALAGALALALGNVIAEPSRFHGAFERLATEQSFAGERIELLQSEEIARKLAVAETEASANFEKAAPALGEIANCIASAIERCGRVIYIGAGTSGRVGALDAVEIPCTFGLEANRFVAVIAGGLSDAALSIEENNEEDCSSVSDLMLLQPTALDVVIGISASGSAYFVRSGLVYAKGRGAQTVLIHESETLPPEDALYPWLDFDLRLHSGPELVSGSTRMKAGTATKKALNILSTTAMIRLGKVRDGYMIDFHCCNAKLRHRARTILQRLENLTEDEALDILEKYDFNLKEALEARKHGRL